jgi:AsmA protein
MGGLLKKILILFLGIVALLVIAAISFVLLFDPNDFREDIAAEVKSTTGRELVIEGELELSLFPWLAINMGKTTLGNAPGFGEEPFASFEQASLSVRVLPMLLHRQVAVGTATLDSFQLNLAVTPNGRSNWQDLIEASEAEAGAVAASDTADAGAASFDIANIEITNASVSYSDAQAGESYRLTNFNVASGRVAQGKPIALSSSFDFELQPADFAGDFAIETVMMLDGDAGTVAFSDVEVTVLGVDISANVEPFSYVEEATPTATLQVDAFSLKSLMVRLNIEEPITADPDALGKIIVDSTAAINTNTIVLSNLNLLVDDTTFKGQLSLARDAAGTISIDLAADSIDLDRYMAPAEEAVSAGGEAMPIEIPADLIRSLNVRGNLTVEEANLSGMKFEGVRLGLNAANGDMRLHPISADFFDGKYEGDVRINASRNTPVLSVNESVRGVSLGSLAMAMFDQENITGSINGSFKLTGRGDDFAAIQRSLNGTMSMELLDGTWEGTDVWYELRRARALSKKESAPEPELPARTRFSAVKATGPVTDGVFRNDDLFAELPFMQLTGKGTVDFAAAEVDYEMSARILDRPEFAQGATEGELAEFTEAVIPLKITGPLDNPTITPDIGEMLKEEVKEKIREKLFEKLLGGDEEAEEEATDEDAEEEKSDRDKLKDALKDLIGG